MARPTLTSFALALLPACALLSACGADAAPGDGADSLDTAADEVSAGDTTPDVTADTDTLEPDLVDTTPACLAESDAELCAALRHVCGPATATDRCGVARVIASCGECPDGGTCATGLPETSDPSLAGTCLPRCGTVTSAGCCTDDGAAVAFCVGDPVSDLLPLRCGDRPCGYSAQYGIFACGFSDPPPEGTPQRCDAYEHAPLCFSDPNSVYCDNVGAECGNPPIADNCNRHLIHNCGTCDGPRQQCSPLGQCTTCGNKIVELGEDCDDGNLDDSDDCLSDCHWNFYCDDSCPFAHNGTCQDFAYETGDRICGYGTDCGDCGIRRDDPCFGFPRGATCDGSLPPYAFLACRVPTGEAFPTFDLGTCRAHERCVQGASPGEDACALDPAYACVVGATRCADDSAAVQTCDADGQWTTSPCVAACVPDALGAYCAPTGETQTVSGYVRYEYRVPNRDLTDWGSTRTARLSAGRVVSFVWNPTLEGLEVFDVAPLATDGTYALRLPASPDARDQVAVVLADLDPSGAPNLIAAQPDLGAGAQSTSATDVAGESSSPWSFARMATRVVTSSTLTLTLADGSGAVRVFDQVARTQRTVRALAGSRGMPLVLWLRPGVRWNCPGCFQSRPTRVGPLDFASSLWIPWGPDESYWSDATVLHELGHWVMASYGTTPAEYGLHYTFQLALPGLAWSEGFATFFSALAREDQVFVFKDEGAFNWADLGLMKWNGTYNFIPAVADGEGYPDRDDPILQRVDEMTLAATCWAIATHLAAPSSPSFERDAGWFLDALRSPRMNVTRLDPEARFARGYVRHTWTTDADGALTDIRAHPTQSAPMLADFLDALRCDANADPDLHARRESAIAEAIGPYPYPTAEAPLCEGPRTAIALSVTGGPTSDPARHTLRIDLRRQRLDDVPLALHIATPPGVKLVGKASELIRDRTNLHITRELELRLTAPAPKGDVVVTLDARSPAYGVHATQRYRFDRPEPSVAAPPTRWLLGPGGHRLLEVIELR